MYPQLKEKIKQQLNKGRKLFIPFITAGYPSYDGCLKIVELLYSAGADIIELGIPFSDPLADGPTIQKSSQIALLNNMSLRKAFDLLSEIKQKINLPIVFMSYYNPIYKLGLNKFARFALKNNLDGIIVPDLPPEEAGDLLKMAKDIDLATIFLLAPTSTIDRIKLVINETKGFIYYVSLTGVTGAREKLPPDLKNNLKKLKHLTNLPICVGFGISKPEHASLIAKYADGVIIGSALINIVEKYKKNYFNQIYKFAKEIREVL